MSPKIYVDKCPSCGFFLRRRTPEQNSALHALLTDISEQKEWAGRKWSVEEWKRLMCGAFFRTQNESPTMAPAIDGHGIEVLYRHTSRMTKQEMSDLLHFATAWAIEQGVALQDPVTE